MPSLVPVPNAEKNVRMFRLRLSREPCAPLLRRPGQHAVLRSAVVLALELWHEQLARSLCKETSMYGASRPILFHDLADFTNIPVLKVLPQPYPDVVPPELPGSANWSSSTLTCAPLPHRWCQTAFQCTSQCFHRIRAPSPLCPRSPMASTTPLVGRWCHQHCCPSTSCMPRCQIRATVLPRSAVP